PGFGSGDYSYGLYLYHTPFLQLLIHYFPQAWTGDRWWTLFFAGFPLSLTAAVISWHLFEYPALKMRNSFVIRRRPEPGSDWKSVPAAQSVKPRLYCHQIAREPSPDCPMLESIATPHETP